MWTRHRKRRNLGRFVLPVITVAIVSYFAYHAVHGSFGLNAKEELDAQVVRLTAELDGLRLQRRQLEERALLLQDGSIERDMLDEKARGALNLVRPDELVILRETN